MDTDRPARRPAGEPPADAVGRRMNRPAVRTALPAALGGGWDGLALDVVTPERPGLEVRAAGARRFLVSQADRVVLLARQRADHYGVHYARTDRYRSPLPPITAAQARRIRGSSADEATWAAHWAYRFTGWLEEAVAGPLHRGSWVLADGMPGWAVPGHWERLRSVDPNRGHITWFGYGDPVEDQRDVLPLRPLSPADSGRVHAYRKQVREGVLPPALLWWVSGLNTLLVLDGHDRIVAALAEGRLPDVVMLTPAPDPDLIAAQQEPELRAYLGRMGHLHGRDDVTPAGLADVSRRFAAALRAMARAEDRTRAWPLPGGPAAWDRLAARLAPGWDTADRP